MNHDPFTITRAANVCHILPDHRWSDQCVVRKPWWVHQSEARGSIAALQQPHIEAAQDIGHQSWTQLVSFSENENCNETNQMDFCKLHSLLIIPVSTTSHGCHGSYLFPAPINWCPQVLSSLASFRAGQTWETTDFKQFSVRPVDANSHLPSANTHTK